MLHFEQVVDFEDEDEAEGMLDPTALLVVLDALAKLTDGIPVDPAGGHDALEKKLGVRS